MTDAEKIVLVKSMTEETDTDVISAFLALAGDAIYHYADPFKQTDKVELLEDYGGVQARAAAYYLNKRGAEGQTSMGENGISRGYEKADLPPSLLCEITPICGIPQ